MMPVRLRGHHFLCILTYRGFGYTPDFVANMTAILAGIAAGRPVRLVAGPDDICGGLSDADRIACDHDCAQQETRLLDDVAIAEIGSHLDLDFTRELIIRPDMILQLRGLFAEGAIRSACQRCLWSDFCTTIAAGSFSETRLFPPGNAGDAG